ncbi:MAG: TetR/AcrR family transcriptional regulator [Candidatus Marinimicrobia bacterium]|nr:TetR/AcrR family transcriptional regulator [Candidatus Neomarinimicrobiota bacterium]
MTTIISEFEQRLYRQGWEIFQQDGIRAFTVETLAQRLGVSKKTIYKVVKTREELIERIVTHTLNSIKAGLLGVIGNETDPVQQFITVGEFLATALSRVQVNRMLELKVRHPRIWKLIEEFRFERREQFANILCEAQKQGLLKADLEIDVLVRLYMYMVNSIFQPEFFAQNNLIIPDTIRLFFKIISEGIFTAEGIKHVESV